MRLKRMGESLMTRNVKPRRAFLRMRALKRLRWGADRGCSAPWVVDKAISLDLDPLASMQPVQTNTGMATSGSGTVQTHVSSYGSHRRLNTSSSLGTLTTVTQGKTPAINPHAKRLDFTNGRPRHLIHIYKSLQRLVLIFLVLFSVHQFTYSVTLPRLLRYIYPKSPVPVTSPLDSMSQAYRLSRLTHLPNPINFESYTISPLNPTYEEDDTTACLCLGHRDTNAFVEWASKWPSKRVPYEKSRSLTPPR
jgi:hypothetical protein